MLLTCDNLIKICNSQIDYVKINKYDSESSRLCVNAYNEIIKFIEEAACLGVDEKACNDFIANKCINALGRFYAPNDYIGNVWDNAMLNIYISWPLLI